MAEEKIFYQNEFEKYMEGRSGPNWKSPKCISVYQLEGEKTSSPHRV